MTAECKELLKPPPEWAGMERRVLPGDFNARMEALTGDTDVNARGGMLNSWTLEWGYTLMLDLLRGPLFTFYGGLTWC